MEIEIKDLLLNFKNSLLREENKIILIQEEINNNLKIKIEKKEIKLKNNIIYLSIKPIQKNEVFLKKEKILSNLKKKLPKTPPTDIR